MQFGPWIPSNDQHIIDISTVDLKTRSEEAT
jgi:hypothetical protein